VSDLPTGTVTLLFTDIEGSTRLLQHLGTQYSEVRSECRSLLRTAFSGTTATSVFDNRKVALPHSKCACLLTILFTVPMSFLRMPTSCCTTYKGKCKEDDIPPDVTASWSLVTLSVTLLRRTYCKIEVRKAAFASTESTSRRRDQKKL